MVSKQAHNHWKTLENDPKVELSKKFLTGGGNGPGELVILTTSGQDGRPPLYCTQPLQAKKNLPWRVNKETGKGECMRLGHKFCALTLLKYLANPKHKCQGQDLSS